MGRTALHSALLRGTLVMTVLLGATSCQRILGIRGGGAATDAATTDGATERADARVEAPVDLVRADAGADATVDAADDRAVEAQDGPVDQMAEAGGNLGPDAGPDVASPLDASDGGAPPDLRAMDASDGPRDGVPSEGGANDAGAGDAAAACAPPWHGENVQARLMTPGTAATACSVAAADIPTLAAAVDATTFRGAQACGACLRVQGSLNTNAVVVPVVERSDVSGLLLTRAAMDQITPGGSLISVDWQLVPCDTRNQPLRYYVKEGSNAGYVGIQVRNARYPIATVAAVGARTSVPLALQSYNYWESTAVGGGPLTLRVTDINGQVVEDSGIKVMPQTESTGQGQFPLCR